MKTKNTYLRYRRILLEQHIHESLFFFDKIMNSEETFACEVLESFIVVVSHITSLLILPKCRQSAIAKEFIKSFVGRSL